jgi:hypothetical protein
MRLDAAAGGFDFGEFGHDSNENVTENSQHGAHAGVEKQSRRPLQIRPTPKQSARDMRPLWRDFISRI